MSQKESSTQSDPKYSTTKGVQNHESNHKSNHKFSPELSPERNPEKIPQPNLSLRDAL